MAITVTNIMYLFNVSRDKVHQQGSKQLFIVDTPNERVLVSYKTTVGKFIDGQWYITTVKYSPTTSKQITQFIKQTMFPVVRVEDINNIKIE